MVPRYPPTPAAAPAAASTTSTMRWAELVSLLVVGECLVGGVGGVHGEDDGAES
jgi:hypothetical protein